MKETDLAKQIVEWLQEQHWEVYQEVLRYSTTADIVAVQGPLVWVIECKTTLSIGVMLQASRWMTHFRSVAVPSARHSRPRNAAFQVARSHFKVGVITVSPHSFAYSDTAIEEEVAAPYMREYRELALRLRDTLEPEHKTFAPAGSADGKKWTPYKRTIRDVRSFLEKNPGSTMRQIQEDIGRGHYASPASMRGNLGKALEHWEDWCRVDRDHKPFKYYVKEDYIDG